MFRGTVACLGDAGVCSDGGTVTRDECTAIGSCCIASTTNDGTGPNDKIITDGCIPGIPEADCELPSNWKGVANWISRIWTSENMWMNERSVRAHPACPLW